MRWWLCEGGEETGGGGRRPLPSPTQGQGIPTLLRLDKGHQDHLKTNLHIRGKLQRLGTRGPWQGYSPGLLPIIAYCKPIFALHCFLDAIASHALVMSVSE